MMTHDEIIAVVLVNSIGVPALFEDFEFADGTPCGKLVEK